jgi:hypothetical protein
MAFYLSDPPGRDVEFFNTISSEQPFAAPVTTVDSGEGFLMRVAA